MEELEQKTRNIIAMGQRWEEKQAAKEAEQVRGGRGKAEIASNSKRNWSKRWGQESGNEKLDFIMYPSRGANASIRAYMSVLFWVSI